MKLYMTQNKKEDILPLIMGVTAFLIFFLYNHLKIMPIFFLGIAFLLLCWLILSFEQLFLFCMILAPNLMSIKLLGSDNAWFGYFLLLVEIKYLCLNRFNISPLFLIHILSVFVTVFLYSESSLFLTLIRNCTFFIYVYSIFRNETLFQKKEFQKQILIYYLLGLGLNVVFGLIFWVINGEDIFNGFFSGIRNGRNFFASIVAHGTGLLLLFTFQKGARFSWLKIFFCLFLLFVGGLTGSRSFLLSSIFIVIEFVFLILKPKNISKGVFILICVISIILLFWDMINPVFNHILDRFEDDTVEGGNGRLEAWEYFLGLTFSSVTRLFFGNGWGEKYFVLGEVVDVEHNSLIQAISTVGLLGASTLLAIYVLLYRAIVKNTKRQSLSVWMPFLAGIFFYMTISALYSDQLNILVVVSFVAINYFTKSKGEKNSDLPLDTPQTHKRLRKNL